MKYITMLFLGAALLASFGCGSSSSIPSESEIQTAVVSLIDKNDATLAKVEKTNGRSSGNEYVADATVTIRFIRKGNWDKSLRLVRPNPLYQEGEPVNIGDERSVKVAIGFSKTEKGWVFEHWWLNGMLVR